jgi:hypothetical protein
MEGRRLDSLPVVALVKAVLTRGEMVVVLFLYLVHLVPAWFHTSLVVHQ